MVYRVLVIDGGGRGHAIVWKLAQSSKVSKIYVAPGNAGTAQLGENIDIEPTDILGLVGFAKKNKIDCTVVGPESSLALGIVDVFQSLCLPIFGPTRDVARIETSKKFAKEVMSSMGARIPTADYQFFTDYNQASRYVSNCQIPIVVKADGLAGGHGVSICHTRDEARDALERLMVKGVCGDGGRKVLVEEYLHGQELSIHALSDGYSYLMFEPAQDYKQAYDGNRGPMTGSMGSFSPVSWVDADLFSKIRYNIVESIFKDLRRIGLPFTGCLYPGLRITPVKISEDLFYQAKVQEFNVRFGDSEAQTYVRRLKSDFFEIIKACSEGKLDEQRVEWHKEVAICVNLVSRGYPGKHKTGFEIKGIEEAEKILGVVVFHAGTKIDESGRLVTNGGRVLSVTAMGSTLEEARIRAYLAAELIHFEGMHYRKDIGLL